jgi:formyltetrahydrofolate hydrolase
MGKAIIKPLSRMNTSIKTVTEQDTYDGFLSNVFKGCENFINQYKNYFSTEQKREILSQKKPNEMIKSLLHRVHVQDLKQKVYILIDEYDHFANQLIAFNYGYFVDIVTQNGYVQNEHKTDNEWPFNKPQYLLLNLAIGGNWGGEKGVDETIFPVRMEVDYVRVFSKNKMGDFT